MLPIRCATRLRPAAARLGPVHGRTLCSNALASGPGGSSDVGKAEAPPLDTGTVSTFTGVPKGMLDTRVVKIFRPAQGVQNATQNTLVWKMQWEDQQTKRWSNPLMGWTSTSDPLSNTHMTLEFGTREDAVRFAERNGWKYEVSEVAKPNLTIVTKGPKKYSDNFVWKGPPGRPFPKLYEPEPPPSK